MTNTPKNDITFERIKDMPQLKREIMLRLFTFISQKLVDQWWRYSGEFKFEGKEYELECDCKYDNQMFTYKNLHIAHKTQVINIQDLVDKGIIH